ncbi:EpsG family protein [Paraburkholderia diazotrophica]|uniref:EpsG family protein n=1 Tax=Paraburkholderia diazotrophica TaxID=667676 RepID=A0A1H7E4J1_9BURK|nr:EpsG family protein [Paraburkholderia diazotrophica]SEK06972.1 EpsG family protein [Paraburkholderia diazotrophica]
MSYYLLAILIFYVGVGLSATYGGTARGVLFIFAVPMLLLVCLRGHTGTDTAAYYTAFTDLDRGNGYGSEPVFNLFSRALWWIDPDPRFVVDSISLTAGVLMLWGIGRSRYGAWFGGLLMVPAMFYELTMNVMRFGLASSIFLLATAVPFEKKPARYLLLALLGTGMHFSSALLFILFIPATKRRHMLIVLSLAVIALAVSVLMPEYLSDKTDLYAGMAAPNESSGLMFLTLQASMLFVIVHFRRQFRVPIAGLSLFGALAIACYVLTQVTYAGIRFQLLLMYLMNVVLMRQYAPRNGRMSPRLAACLFVIGLVAMAGRFHNMLDEEGRGASPFLPYRAIPALEEFQ